MLQKNINHGISGSIVIGFQSEIPESLVFSDQCFWLIRKQIQKSFQVGTGQGCFEVFNDIELDISRTQYCDCAA